MFSIARYMGMESDQLVFDTPVDGNTLETDTARLADASAVCRDVIASHMVSCNTAFWYEC